MQQNYNKKTTPTAHRTLAGTLLTLLYRVYVLFVFLPLFLVSSVITATVTAIGCRLGNAHFWGYHPGRLWGQFVIRALLLPVRVEGREHLRPNQSYVFVSNHQGSFDIFLIYGFLGRNFKWMMKKSIRKIPFVGIACECAHHIFVDKSVVVFPEGARTFTGHIGIFRRGAFMLADELQLPVCPITINGSFDVMPRTRDWHFPVRHRLSLTIHEPIAPKGKGAEFEKETMKEAYDSIESGLEEQYKGFVENPDQ